MIALVFIIQPYITSNHLTHFLSSFYVAVQLSINDNSLLIDYVINKKLEVTYLIKFDDK